MARGKQRPSDLRVYIDKYIERIPESGCWLWMGALFKNGYGQTRLKGLPHSAHRLSWHIYRGSLTDIYSVLHRCDVRCCCNPAHLFLGSQQENLRDMVQKKRNRKHDGSHIGCTKLTNEQAMQILADERTQDAIAKDHGISQSMVSLIKKRQAWKHITTHTGTDLLP